ncbi:hypothetical protein ACJX0J_034357, partial [Zea mays]
TLLFIIENGYFDLWRWLASCCGLDAKIDSLIFLTKQMTQQLDEGISFGVDLKKDATVLTLFLTYFDKETIELEIRKRRDNNDFKVDNWHFFLHYWLADFLRIEIILEKHEDVVIVPMTCLPLLYVYILLFRPSISLFLCAYIYSDFNIYCIKKKKKKDKNWVLA